MELSQFLDWLQKLVQGFASVGAWLFSPIFEYKGWSITPILLTTVGGLTVFLVIAVVKWGLS